MNEEKMFQIVEKKLHEYKNMQYQLEALDRKIECEKSSFDGGLKGINYDSDRLSPSNSISSMVENEVLHKEEKLNRLLLTKKKIERDKTNIEKAIETLQPREKELFKIYYLSRKSINADGVAMQMFIDRATFYNIKRVMLKKICSSIYPEYTYQGLPLFEEFKK